MTNASEFHAVIQENAFPKGFHQLLSHAEVENTLDSISVFLHACMLDVGFLPKDIEEENIYKCLPEGWKSTGAWKFQYSHKSCPQHFCWMTCVPFYSFIAVHGALDDSSSHNSIYIKLKTTNYINDQTKSKAIEDIFIHSNKLEQVFKDGFCFSLLAVLQESTGCPPSFGLCITVDEIKVHILKLLPVESVVAMSRVNKDFNRIASSKFLWKFLLRRDFGLVDTLSRAFEENYKEVYKREYAKKRQRMRVRLPRRDPYFGPPYLPVGPSSYVDIMRDLDPAIQQAFPYLRDRFRPNRFLPPYDFPGWFM